MEIAAFNNILMSSYLTPVLEQLNQPRPILTLEPHPKQTAFEESLDKEIKGTLEDHRMDSLRYMTMFKPHKLTWRQKKWMKFKRWAKGYIPVVTNRRGREEWEDRYY